MTTPAPDFNGWVAGRQRVQATRNTGEKVRGTVSAYQPAALIVDIDDGTRGSFPTSAVVAVTPADDQTDPVAEALHNVSPAQATQWDLIRRALDTAGYRVVRKGAAPTPPTPGGP